MSELRKRKDDEVLKENIKGDKEGDENKPSDCVVKGQKSVFKSINISVSVLTKFIIATIAMFTLPLLTYFYSVSRFGSTTAGILAAITANMVVVMYVVVAFLEGDE
jgi:hypothetical protein